MKIQKVVFDNDTRCMFNEGVWISELSDWSYDAHGSSQGIKIDHVYICNECLENLHDGKKILESSKKFLSIEI